MTFKILEYMSNKTIFIIIGVSCASQTVSLSCLYKSQLIRGETDILRNLRLFRLTNTCKGGSYVQLNN